MCFNWRRQPFKKNVVIEEGLDDIDIDDIGNSEDSPSIVFIDEQCESLTVVNDGGELHETFILDSMVPVNGKNCKTTPDERATTVESLHVRQKFSFNSKIFTRNINHRVSLIFCSDCSASKCP